MRFVLILVLLVGCGTVNRAALIASTASIACDWAQTRAIAATGWAGRMEANPIMGPRPSTQTVDAYFVGVAAINAAVWYVMPKKIKSIVPGVVIGVQADAIRHNVRSENAGSICGL